MKHLTPIASDVDKIVLGRQHGVEDWVQEGLSSVLVRQESLTHDEGKRMKVEDIIEINSIRQLLGPGEQSKAETSLSVDAKVKDFTHALSCISGSTFKFSADTLAALAGKSSSKMFSAAFPNQTQPDRDDTMIQPQEPQIIAEESGAEEKSKEVAERQRADRTKKRDAARRALKNYFDSPTWNNIMYYTQSNASLNKAREQILEEFSREELQDCIASYIEIK